jgi:hypothetical protein
MKNLKVFPMLMLALFLLISMSLSPTQKMNTKKASVFKPYEEFGIVTQEDIYPDTIDLRLYTSHGRLKYVAE